MDRNTYLPPVTDLIALIQAKVPMSRMVTCLEGGVDLEWADEDGPGGPVRIALATRQLLLVRRLIEAGAKAIQPPALAAVDEPILAAIEDRDVGFMVWYLQTVPESGTYRALLAAVRSGSLQMLRPILDRWKNIPGITSTDCPTLDPSRLLADLDPVIWGDGKPGPVTTTRHEELILEICRSQDRGLMNEFERRGYGFKPAAHLAMAVQDSSCLHTMVDTVDLKDEVMVRLLLKAAVVHQQDHVISRLVIREGVRQGDPSFIHDWIIRSKPEDFRWLIGRLGDDWVNSHLGIPSVKFNLDSIPMANLFHILRMTGGEMGASYGGSLLRAVLTAMEEPAKDGWQKNLKNSSLNPKTKTTVYWRLVRLAVRRHVRPHFRMEGEDLFTVAWENLVLYAAILEDLMRGSQLERAAAQVVGAYCYQDAVDVDTRLKDTDQRLTARFLLIFMSA